jgi:prepilin-type N-terminal cleavage/methylation domain-containing protein
MNAALARRGFTLVELLVVTGLIASFLGLILVGMRPTGDSQIRQLSQTLSSAILASQTRALGNDAGAALIFDTGAGSVAFAGNMIYNADVPPLVVGTISGVPPSPLNVTTTTGTLSPTNADATDLATGYRIRFSGTSPYMPPTNWMAFASGGSNMGTISFRTTANQTISNTVWPAAPATGSLQFAVARYPIRSTSALDATRQAAVDFRYSGIGNATWGTSGTNSLALTFDRNGSLDTVMTLGATPGWANPTAPIYFLIASLADIQNDQSLQSPTARWLAINPSTGRVSVGANVVSGTDVLAARANARQGVTAGVK